MSPHEIRKRFQAQESGSRIGSVDESMLERAGARLAAIMSDVAAIPVGDYFPQTRALPRRSPSQALRWFVLFDVVSFICGYVAAWAAASFFSSFFLNRPFAVMSVLDEGFRFLQFGGIAACVMLWFWHTGHYRSRMPFWFETQKVVSALCVALIVDGFFQFAAKQDFSRAWLMASWAFAGLAIVLARHVARNVMIRTGGWQLRTLLVGNGTVADETRAVLRSEPELGYEVVMQIENLPLLLESVSNSWERLCDRFNADYVVIAQEGPDLADSENSITLLAREKIPFSVSPPVKGLPLWSMRPQYFFNHDIMLMTHADNLTQPLPRFLKRGLDIAGSGLGLLLLSPLLLLLAFLVGRDGGPVFFRDRRIGMDARPFDCLKFRSMVLNADAALEAYLEAHPIKRAEWNKYHKLRDGDPRVTKVGAFMRRWSLDELPQLINVLRGDMSLVGPRPINATEQGGYRQDILHYHRVRPGLTGLWQVSGRSDVDFARRVQMDSWYVRNWSLWHDVAILFKTIPAVLKKTGAC